MKCYLHNDRDAVATCKQCGKSFCRECSDSMVRGLCSDCVAEENAYAEQEKVNAKREALVDTKKEYLTTAIKGVIAATLWTFFIVSQQGFSFTELGTIFMVFTIPFGYRMITYLESFVKVLLFLPIVVWVFYVVLKIIAAALLGIPCFIYQTFITFFRIKKIKES